MSKRVFVSSTFEDLKLFREAVGKAIRQLGAVDVSMEHFGARDERPKDECLRLIAEESDFFVGIYAHRYGHVPHGDKVSITEAEYDAAIAAKIPVLIYLVDEQAPWVPAHIDGGQAKSRLDKFKKRLRAARMYASFTSKDDLATKVAADLGRYLSGKEERVKSSGIRSSLPRQPYFFGREKELEKIADALSPESRSWGALIDGPGGIGKTALAVRAGHVAPVEHFPLKIFLSAKVRELSPAGQQPLEDFMLPNFTALISELARELGEADIARTPPNERANTVRRALTDKKALLVIDNVETFEETERVRLYQFLGRLPGGCKAIVTSRRRTDIDARAIRLDRLELEDALDLIAELVKNNRHLARADERQRQELYEITHGNPLLIKWVAGQLGREGSQCRTIPEACEFIKSAPKENDPLEFIFGDLLDTFTDSETAVLAALTHFTQPAKIEWIAELTGLALPAAQTALEDLADRALLVSDETLQTFLLPPLAATFLRRTRPEAVSQTGNRLTARAYALAMANGFQNYERFPHLETEWPTISAALPLFLRGDNLRLQWLCDALNTFLDFSGRSDEQLSLLLRAKENALTNAHTVDAFNEAGLRAYQAGLAYRLRRQGDKVLAYAAECEAHWRKAKAGGSREARAIRLRGLGHELNKNYSAAKKCFQEALTLQHDIEPESVDVVIVLNDLAIVERALGDVVPGRLLLTEALRIAEKANYQEGVATSTSNLAEIELDRHNWRDAETAARKALSLAEAFRWRELIGVSCRRLAKALARQGHPQDGLLYAQRAVESFSALGMSEELDEAQAVLEECEGC